MYHGSVCVGALCVETVLKVEGEREEKKIPLKSQENVIEKWLERNNKKRLKK